MATNELVLELDFRNKRYKRAEVGLKAFSKTLEQNPAKLGPVLAKELKDFLDTVAEAMGQRHGNPWHPGARGPEGARTGRLFRRSGKGLQGIRDSVKVTGSTLETVQGFIGAPFPLSVHEVGAIVRAKRAKYLTIPLPDALNANGTPKKRSARQWANTFVQTSKKGNLIIFQTRGRKIVPLYLLKPMVKIPPRLGLGVTLNTGVPFFVERAMDRMLAVMVKEL